MSLAPAPEWRRALAAAVRGGAMTAVVAPSDPDAATRAALGALLEALPRIGVGRRRVLVVLACATDGRPAGRARERALAGALGVPVFAHDPAHSACFAVGRTRAGLAVEVHDELREAEAVIVLGADAAGDAGALVVPGLASARTRAALDPAAWAEARALVGVDLWLVAGADGAPARGAAADLDPPFAR